MVWLSTIGVAIYENGVAIYEWCGYLRMVWLSTKKVWLFQLAFLGLLVGAKNIIQIPLFCIFNTLREVVQSSAHRVDNESIASLETKLLNYCLNAVDAQNVQSNQDLL